MIHFILQEDGRVSVNKCGLLLGLLEKQFSGQTVYNCHAEINYVIEDLESILDKMKESENEKI